MPITITLATLSGIATIALIRFRWVSLPVAAAVWISGFTAAGTGAAGPVNSFLTALIHLVNHH
ncbi:hypothetical protein [Kitasatospora viridis]|uniref:Uncharacterized protein n=1 Tax=Kitasatospora viridis TaxID=281105 RepID=A0A561UDV4_9ACTN|nr:hypothetical protein [Kitasatospora viridis]TWF97518.1 hypothetical protein FHX73_111299 [Kitasatospora viridis]